MGASKQKIELPPFLSPKGKMRPNEPCWCGSGKKWKKCHRTRSEQQGPNYFEVLGRSESIFRKGYCSHPSAPDGCSKGIIRSHTLQKSGVLSSIAEAGHVYSVRGTRSKLHETGGRVVPQRTGINSASTFFGFCNAHDTAFFKPIEGGGIPLSSESAFLITYRAMAYELFAKRASIQSTKAMLADSDAGQSLNSQVFLQNMLNSMLVGMEVAEEELSSWKGALDERYFSGDYSEINLSVTRFETQLPFVASCAFHPEYDLAGAHLQTLMHKNLEQVTFVTVAEEGQSTVAFAWEGEPDGAAERFVRSFEELNDKDKATAAFLICLVHTENWHALPSWWEGLSEEVRFKISDFIHVGMPMPGSMGSGVALNVKGSPVRFDSEVLGVERL